MRPPPLNVVLSSMFGAGKMDIIDSISYNKGISDLNMASDEVKLDVYRLTIEELFKILKDNNLRTFPKASLDEFENGLTEISSGFYDLARRPIGNKFRITNIISSINEANSYLSAALVIHGKEDKFSEYLQHLQNCRNKLFEATELLEAIPYNDDGYQSSTSEVILPSEKSKTTVSTPPQTKQPPASSPSPNEIKRPRKKRATSPITTAPTQASLETIKQGQEDANNNAIDDTTVKQGLENADDNAIDDTAVGIKDDKLNFKIYADALYAFITSQDTTTPLTISINGPWGMGKSSLMKMLKEKLEPPRKVGKEQRESPTRNRRDLIWQGLAWKFRHIDLFSTLWLSRLLLSFGGIEEHNAQMDKIEQQISMTPFFHPTVWFNAWKYSQEEQLWAALALESLAQIKQKYGFIGRIIFWLRLTYKRSSGLAALGNIIKKVAIPLILAFIAIAYDLYIKQQVMHAFPHGYGFLQGFIPQGTYLLWAGALLSGLIQVASIAKDPFQIQVKDIVDKPDYKDKLGFIGSFETDFSRIVSVATHPHIGWQPQKLVIFIDDLDRCRPFQTVSIVEAISLFLDSKQCVFVIGMDPSAVTTNIEAKYKELVEKIRRETPGIVSPGSLFLDKIIQISFNIPRPTSKDIDTLVEGITRPKGKSPTPQNKSALVEGITYQKNELLTELIPAFPAPPQIQTTINTPTLDPAQPIKDVASFEHKDVQDAIKIASRYLKENPRLVKKFINIFRLKVYLADKLDMLHGQSLTPLAVLIAWSMQWPEVVKLLLDEAHSSDVSTYLAEICENIQEDGNWKVPILAQKDQRTLTSEINQFINGLKMTRTTEEKSPAHWCHLPWEEWIRDKDFRCCLKSMEKEKLWQHLRRNAHSEEILNLAQLMRI